MKWLDRFRDEAYALLRIVAGAMFLFHGLQKIFGVLTERAQEPFTQIWIGGLIELVGGTCIALGLLARPAAFLCSGMMAVAYVQFHWKLETGAALLPAVNRGEMAVLYCFIFFAIACGGAGKWSVGGRR